MRVEQIILKGKEAKEKITSKIDLRFFRHAEKESVIGIPDEEIELTEAGKKQAVEKSEGHNVSQSLAFGSPRKRTQQTAGLILGGKLDDITGNETLNELKKKLDSDLRVGSKIGVDNRLDFNHDFSTEYGEEAMEAYKNGKYLKFLVENSDEVAESLKDEKGETYSRMAGRIAGIVEKYIAVASRWNELVQDERKNYEDTLKRVLSTHMGVGESFLAKVIEKTKGKAERDLFVSSLNNQGFDFAEGFNIEINTINGNNQTVRIIFKKEVGGQTIFEYNETVSKEIIDSIIFSKPSGI